MPRRIGRLRAGNQRSFSGHVSKEASRWNFQKEGLNSVFEMFEPTQFPLPEHNAETPDLFMAFEGCPFAAFV